MASIFPGRYTTASDETFVVFWFDKFMLHLRGAPVLENRRSFERRRVQALPRKARRPHRSGRLETAPAPIGQPE
jgi:hypothetical protein